MDDSVLHISIHETPYTGRNSYIRIDHVLYIILYKILCDKTNSEWFTMIETLFAVFFILMALVMVAIIYMCKELYEDKEEYEKE